MLIRSQDKTKIINVDNVSVIDFFSMNGVVAISVEALDASCNIAEYSTRENAIKVLDMIQEVCAEYVTTKTFGTGMGLCVEHEYNTYFIKDLENRIREKVVFQMPADSEVEV